MTIAFANHKGGTGKTTSVINIGKALANLNYKVLLVDLDPQANLTYSLGLAGQPSSIADLLLSLSSFEQTACEASGMHVLPADLSLYEKGIEISKSDAANFALKNALVQVKSNYDFILLDCSPAFSLYTMNAFNAADGIIIPVVFDILSVQGLDQMLREVIKFRESTNPGLMLLGAVGVIINENRKLTEEVLEYIRDQYQVNVFNNRVRNNVKAAEAPSFGLSVLEYAPSSISSRDYVNVAKELLAILEMETKY